MSSMSTGDSLGRVLASLEAVEADEAHRQARRVERQEPAGARRGDGDREWPPGAITSLTGEVVSWKPGTEAERQALAGPPPGGVRMVEPGVSGRRGRRT
jgi:hypothetical protein